MKKWMLYVIETIKLTGQYFKVYNPQSVKKHFYEKLKKSHKDFTIEEYKKRAKRFQYLGDFYWSKKSVVSGNISGWYYVLAGDSLVKCADWKQAGYLYHFAGNQFRRIGALEKAMRFYFYSAQVHLEHCADDESCLSMGHRSARRAIGLSKSSGDEKVLRNWMADENYFKIYTNQFPSQNIWD